MRAVSVTRFGRVLLASCALGLPFVLVASSVSGFVEPLSRLAVEALLRASAPLQAPAEPAPLVEPPSSGEPSSSGEPLAPNESVLAAGRKAPAGRKVTASRPQPPPSLFVSAAKVLQLSQSAARPQGAFVAATAAHPSGLRLSGVAALGIGVQDGDILIEAMGMSPQSPGQIIGAIIEARAKQARYLGGTIWRRGQTFRITVEQPYLSPEAPSP
jgi:hypothetical protein